MKRLNIFILCGLLAVSTAAVAAVPRESAAGEAVPAGREQSAVRTTVEPTEATVEAEPVAVIKAEPEPMPEAEPETASAVSTPAEQAPQTAAVNTTDLYHTDVYPKNVYSEELIYDADGNLIGKTTTYPTAFGPDTIWIDGHAYYDVPGFGLIE